MQVKETTVRLQALDGTWEVCGVDRKRGIWPERVLPGADGWGSSTVTFELHRDPRATWPDLGAWTPVEIEIGGTTVWSGRIEETPTRDSADRVITVQCKGWQYHLDDPLYEKYYVHSRLGDWRDARTFPGVDVQDIWRSATQVSVDQGVITIGYPRDPAFSGPPVGAYAGVILDLGPNSTAAAISIDYLSSNNLAPADPKPSIRAATLSSLAGEPGVAGSFSFPFAATSLTASSGQSLSGVFSSPQRYVAVYAQFSLGLDIRYSLEVWWRITGIRVYTSDAYRSGVDATSFDIPTFGLTEPRTPREVWASVNAYHDWIAKIDVDKRPIFTAKPTAPKFEVGSWSPLELEDQSANSGEDIYNRVTVTGTQPDGTPLRVTRTSTDVGLVTLVDRRGFVRSKSLQISSAITVAAATQIADLWLVAHSTTPYKGSFKLTGDQAVRDPATGAPVPLEQLLLNTGELIRDTAAIDPDTGGIGRDGRIAAVTYDPEADAATVTLDNSRATFEALLARFDLVAGA